jgi:fluoride exporter
VIYIWVALGGALGSVARFSVAASVNRLFGLSFPLGTLVVNVLGSFAIGYILTFMLNKFPQTESYRYFLVTGFLGGFTTFSAFTFDILQQLQRGDNLMALVYVLSSVLLGLAAVVLGYMLAQGSLA